jgi:hypothetical protein
MLENTDSLSYLLPDVEPGHFFDASGVIRRVGTRSTSRLMPIGSDCHERLPGDQETP